jgi:surfactin family lipopeptide synthetase C
MSKTNIEAVYPLSPMQHGMLFHTVYAPESGVYVEQLHCTLRGDLDVEAFKQAWQQVINRHAVLRTAFEWQLRSDPLQVVLRKVALNWQQHDWRGLSPVEQRARLDELLAADRTQGFALDQAPLMRQILIRLDDQSYRFVWSSHHILLDGWSRPLVLKEVFAYYEAFRQGETLHLDQPRSYRAYITWLNKQSLEAAEDFWRTLLYGFSEPTPLPFDRVGPRKATPKSGCCCRRTRPVCSRRLPASTNSRSIR